jgi:hypothetical protein
MSRLPERYVRDVAVKWLACYYQRPGVQVVLPEKEVRVGKKNKLGKGQADGLIVALLSDDSVYTASLEAKSSKTRRNIIPSPRDGKWLLHAVLIGIGSLVLAEVVGQWLGGWFLIWVLPVLVFILVGFAYLVITLGHSHYRAIDVIDQVRNYPANEQWIAISADAYDQLETEQEGLHKDSHKEGIGLMRISVGEQVTLLSTPVPKEHQDFLTCYAREKSIRQKLQMWKEQQTQVVSSLSKGHTRIMVGGPPTPRQYLPTAVRGQLGK